jgi:Na+-transporting methylmalonyl-CoA/oxaloacetate decarboxylase gamma subunit
MFTSILLVLVVFHGLLLLGVAVWFVVQFVEQDGGKVVARKHSKTRAESRLFQTSHRTNKVNTVGVSRLFKTVSLEGRDLLPNEGDDVSGSNHTGPCIGGTGGAGDRIPLHGDQFRRDRGPSHTPAAVGETHHHTSRV